MATLLVILGGVVFAAFFIWIGWRRADRQLPKDVQEFTQLLKRHDRLKRQDPVAAERLMASYEAQLKAGWEALRQRVPTDPAAASQFQQKAQDEIQDFEAMIDDLRRRAKKDHRAGVALANAEHHLAELRKDLEWSRRFLPPSGGGAA